jgi:hypothetical protein
MKKLLFLLVLIFASALDDESVAFLNQAAAAGGPRAALDAPPERAYGIEHRIKGRDQYQSNEKRLLTAHGPTNEIEAKRLKLIFLLILSQGQYRVPVY